MSQFDARLARVEATQDAIQITLEKQEQSRREHSQQHAERFVRIENAIVDIKDVLQSIQIELKGRISYAKGFIYAFSFIAMVGAVLGVLGTIKNCAGGN